MSQRSQKEKYKLHTVYPDKSTVFFSHSDQFFWCSRLIPGKVFEKIRRSRAWKLVVINRIFSLACSFSIHRHRKDNYLFNIILHHDTGRRHSIDRRNILEPEGKGLRYVSAL